MLEELWKELDFEMKTCKRCKLYQNRKNVVLGQGNKKSPIMFIGEVPNSDEDEQGKTFVGTMGGLLTRIFTSVDLEREELYLTNVVKCKPDGTKGADDEDIEICYAYLEAEIALLNPKLIVTMGVTPTKAILKDRISGTLAMTKLRGKVFDWEGGIKVIPMFHPNFLLRNTSTTEGSPKWLTWQDMKMIKNEYDKLRKEDSY